VAIALFTKTFEEMLLVPCASLSPAHRQNAWNRAGLMTSGSVILVAVLFTVSSGVFSTLCFAGTELCCFFRLGVIVGCAIAESVGLYNNFVIIPCLGSHIF